MARADLDAAQAGGDQRAGDSEILVTAEPPVGVAQPEREPDQRGDRRERDVALGPAQPDAEDLLAVPLVAAHDALALRGGRVAAGLRAGEREARDLLAARETRQVVVALRVGAVVEQQLRRAERVRNHHRHRRGEAAARELLEHRRMRLRREAASAVALGDDQAEEALAAQELPDLLRQIARLYDQPVVEPRAEILDRAVEERLFGWRQRLLAESE